MIVDVTFLTHKFLEISAIAGHHFVLQVSVNILTIYYKLDSKEYILALFFLSGSMQADEGDTHQLSS